MYSDFVHQYIDHNVKIEILLRVVLHIVFQSN